MSSRAILCADHEPVEIEPPGLSLTLVPELCQEPRNMLEHLTDDVFVLGLSRRAYSLAEVQRALRSAGVDPFAVPIVDLQDAGTGERLFVTLRGALARAEAFRGSGPEHAKAVVPSDFNRRDVFKLGQPAYLPAPAVDPGSCQAASGCRACVDVCPQSAYQWTGTAIEYDKSICEPCGLCVTTCPVGAIDNPTATPSQVTAQIRALVAAASEPIGIVITCRGAQPDPHEGWYDVELPCAAMATPQWLLAPLVMGAGAVSARPCSETGCPRLLDAVIASNLDYSRALLEEFGLEARRVGPEPIADIPSPFDSVSLPDPLETGRFPGLLAALAHVSGAEALSIAEHPASPVGIIEINPETCTGCTTCAETCPTGALQLLRQDETIEISFDAASCTACGQCVPRCPERVRGAIKLQRRTDLATLQAGRSVLYTERALTCEKCGAPIAAAPVLERISSMLGPEREGVMSVIGRLCIDCRGAG